MVALVQGLQFQKDRLLDLFGRLHRNFLHRDDFATRPVHGLSYRALSTCSDRLDYQNVRKFDFLTVADLLVALNDRLVADFFRFLF